MKNKNNQILSFSKSVRFKQLLVFVFGFLLLFMKVQMERAEARGSSWDSPYLISDIGATYPDVVADPYGGLHAFWATGSDVSDPTPASERPIYYSRWNREGWSVPVDVVIGSQPEALVSDDGFIHLFWSRDNAIWHAWNSIWDAQNVQKWHTGPAVANVGAQASAWFPFAVQKDVNGTFHLVFNNRDDYGTWSIFYTRSSDQGITWLTPVTIAQMDSRHSCILPRLAVDAEGGLHVTWTQEQLPDGWPPTGVFYARSLDEGVTWSEPVQLGFMLTGWSNIATIGDSIVHVVWNGSADGQGRHHSWSSDRGTTWSSAQLIVDQGGLTQGWPVLAVDSNNYLHWADFGHTGDAVTGWETIVYAYWDGYRWSTPEYLSPFTESGGYVAQPTMVIEGNRLHLMWVNIAREGLNNTPGVWYATKNTGSTALPSLPSPTPKTFVDSLPSPTAEPVDSAFSTTVPEVYSTTVATVEKGNPMAAIVAGVIPVFILILMVLMWKRIRKA